MVGASDPVRGPHPIRASGESAKDDSCPVRGPRSIRASGQEKKETVSQRKRVCCRESVGNGARCFFKRQRRGWRGEWNGLLEERRQDDQDPAARTELLA